jgi:PAS domain S-box-containing protein
MTSKRILIVDDEVDIALILKLHLEDAGYRTVRAKDGLEALEYIAREIFDLVLLDIKMPRMSGMEVLENIISDRRDTAVVMMTAHGSEDIAVEAMKKGAIDYIAKPFSTDDMLKRVERAIQFHRTRQENVRLQQEVAEERQKMATILEGMADLLIAVDAEGRIMTVNRTAACVLGVDSKQSIGMLVEEVLKGDIAPESLPCRVALQTASPCLDVAYTVKTAKGDVPVLSSAAPLVNSAGGLLGSVEIIRDISTLKALERERQDFVSMLSHDLKSPITAIVGSIDLVRDARLGPVNRDQREYLESALESCSEMVEMIDTLLDVHKFEAGKMVLVFKEEDLELLIQRTLSRYRPVAERARINLYATTEGELPAVRVDRNKFGRLLSNLLSNAFKFTPEGGEIEVRAGVAAAGAALTGRIPTRNYPAPEIPDNARFLQLKVRDSGAGIPREDLADIFDRFVQARMRHTEKARGTGLGLAFCRKVMDTHGGYIWAESVVGEGSSFIALFPLDGGTTSD